MAFFILYYQLFNLFHQKDMVYYICSDSNNVCFIILVEFFIVDKTFHCINNY